MGDFGHGELAGVVHPLGLVDQRGSHLRFASAGAAADACGGKPGLGRAGVTPMTIYRNITTVQTTANWGRT